MIEDIKGTGAIPEYIFLYLGVEGRSKCNNHVVNETVLLSKNELYQFITSLAIRVYTYKACRPLWPVQLE